ncbi:MAG: TIGR03936 family radical SAM-associated protein, partial [Eubacteriales bacterium]|nr:TIGR03936 family radical SAM-associated protein [Eubacteriales bacterium]
MKVRIKFSKQGPVKFVGHLDTMRYFQKAIRRAGLPAAFSGGYSPHMIMSFAAPLGVGTTSRGEYFDVEFTETLPTKEIVERLNSTMAEGMEVLSARQVEDGKAGKAMSLVAAADYYVEFREGKEPKSDWKDKISQFLSQEEILVTK